MAKRHRPSLKKGFPKRTDKKRFLALERLEHRLVMAADWRNPVDASDVDSDGSLAAGEALTSINRINAFGSLGLPTVRPAAEPFYDVNGDSHCAPDDALAVINDINSRGAGKRTLVEGSAVATTASVTITVGPL